MRIGGDSFGGFGRNWKSSALCGSVKNIFNWNLLSTALSTVHVLQLIPCIKHLYNLWGSTLCFYYFTYKHATQMVIRGKRKTAKIIIADGKKEGKSGRSGDSIGMIPSTANLIYILSTSNSAINFVVFVLLSHPTAKTPKFPHKKEAKTASTY